MATPETKPLSTPNSSNVELKLLINKKEEKVLYAEANKEFVDFLFSLMSLPLGMIIKLLENKETVGSIGDLYNSIKSLNQTYLQSSKQLDPVLNPKLPKVSFESPLLLTNTDSMKQNARLFMCSYRERLVHTSKHYVTDDCNTRCPDCKNRMISEVTYVTKDCAKVGSSSGGFVKELVTDMVMDNLEVKPLSTISGLALLNSFHIQDLSSLEEMVVRVGAAEALKLLEESLKTKNVLTSVFLTQGSKNAQTSVTPAKRSRRKIVK
ncbi:hypothetical protein M5689_001820 [Euphorbia peplus]|nr:hypothetical protein M5689_001820 [Euphorbia peplus]